MKNIDIRKKPMRLEAISVGDVLIFPERKETVEQVNTFNGSLQTKRIVKNEYKNSPISPRNFPFREELILYKHIGEVGPLSTGSVYDWVKRRTVEV